jgi:hypothetical protein
MANLLPGVFQRTLRPESPLAAVLEAMAALHAPAERAIVAFPDRLDPRRTPHRFVPVLARWVDLDRLFADRARGNSVGADVEPTAASIARLWPPGLGRLRELIANAAELSRWRGTRRGLLLFLRVATGFDGFEVDDAVPGEDGQPRPFFVRVRAPAAAQKYEDLIERIIRSERPAHVKHELVFGAGAGPGHEGETT